jgi:LCP family protein required for cell wall assembly
MPESGGRPAPRHVGRITFPTDARPHHHRVASVLKGLVALVAAFALAFTGAAWGYVHATNNSLNIVDALDRNSTDIRDAQAQNGDETYLIVGIDSRIGENAEVGAGFSEGPNEGARSDTMMLVNIPANRERVVIVSFPRDLNISRPSCQKWGNYTSQYTDETVPAEDNVKLNSAYYEGGPKCLIKMIQRLSGMRINHFIGIDFVGFEAMVEQVGGVEVCATEPLIDDELGVILAEPGRQTINGQTALNYVRARKVGSEGTNDYGRIKRQQLFLSSLLRQVLSTKVLFDPSRLNGFINAFTEHTFVQNVDTASLLALSRSLQGIDAGHVTFVTIPTAGTNEYVNEIPRPEDMAAIFDAIIDDQPLPGEAPLPADGEGAASDETPADRGTTARAVSAGRVNVQVSNGSYTDGLASTTASALAQYGFQIYSVGDNPEVSEQTVVRYSGGSEDEAVTLASAIPNATLERVTGLGSIVELVLGADFEGSVRSPAQAGRDVTVGAAGSDETAAPAAELPEDLAVTNAADTSCA